VSIMRTSYKSFFSNGCGDCSYAVRAAENTLSEHYKWDIYFCDSSNSGLESGSISTILYLVMFSSGIAKTAT
jgi:hypothetical protein